MNINNSILEKKLFILKNSLYSYNKLAIAFSGGVDSTLLVKIAHDVLSTNITAIIAKSNIFSPTEHSKAISFLKSNQIPYTIVNFNAFEIPEFSLNPIDRCYFCKKHLFKQLIHEAAKWNISYLADGSNLDDLNDYRPGLRALKELNILSPLQEANFSKTEIRFLSKQYKLATFDKPSLACLASRIPYNTKITNNKLQMILKSEDYISSLGFSQIRVRYHDSIARIEISQEELPKFLSLSLFEKIQNTLYTIGFKYVCLDLKGYRTGSLNETLYSLTPENIE